MCHNGDTLAKIGSSTSHAGWTRRSCLRSFLSASNAPGLNVTPCRLRECTRGLNQSCCSLSVPRLGCSRRRAARSHTGSTRGASETEAANGHHGVALHKARSVMRGSGPRQTSQIAWTGGSIPVEDSEQAQQARGYPLSWHRAQHQRCQGRPRESTSQRVPSRFSAACVHRGMEVGYDDHQGTRQRWWPGLRTPKRSNLLGSGGEAVYLHGGPTDLTHAPR
jgi:hypothetical protein